MAQRLRTVARQPRFEREARALFHKVRRADEALEGLEWVLSRHPEWGMAVRGYDTYSTWPLHLPDATYTVLYHYTDDAVTLLALRRAVSPGLELY